MRGMVGIGWGGGASRKQQFVMRRYIFLFVIAVINNIMFTVLMPSVPPVVQRYNLLTFYLSIPNLK